MKFFFKDFVMSSGRFNLPLQQIKVLFFPELHYYKMDETDL